MEKQKNLVKKLTQLISVILVIIFAVFILFSVVQLSSKMNSMTKAELSQMADANASTVENILTPAVMETKNITAYLEGAFAQKNKEETAEEDMIQSNIYPDLKLTFDEAKMEDFLIEMGTVVNLNNQDIVAIGAYFEPYAFSKDQKSYAMYVVSNTGEAVVGSSGKYEDYSQKELYKKAVEKGGLTTTSPYTDNQVTGLRMLTVAAPIMHNGKVMGVAFADISIERFGAIDVQSENYPSLGFTIGTQDETIAYHSTNPDLIEGNMSETFAKAKDSEYAIQRIKAKETFYMKVKDEDNTSVYKFFHPIDVGDESWAMATIVDTSDIQLPVAISAFMQAVMAVVAALVLIIIVSKVLERMLAPITVIVSAADQIAAGNLDIDIPVQSDDEIGMLAETFQNTATYLSEMIHEISSVLGEVSKNNLNVTTGDNYRGDFVKIKVSMDQILDNLNEVMREMNLAADQVSGAADEVAEASLHLAEGATEQAGSVQELSAAMNEVSNQATKSAKDAGSIREEVLKVSEEVARSNEKMQQMIHAMGEISSSSNEIHNIIKTIEAIAAQTNLLALNASIEAARAGEAGKGFAVVADQVSILAAQSAQAASSTTQLIEQSIKAVENGTAIVDDTAQTLINVVEDTNLVVENVGNIVQASNEQKDVVAQVNGGVDQISMVVENNSAVSQESAASSEELSNQAQILKEIAGKFTLRQN